MSKEFSTNISQKGAKGEVSLPVSPISHKPERFVFFDAGRCRFTVYGDEER